MRAVVIVIVLPSADLLPGLAEGREQRLVQQLVPEAPVEALDEAPRHGPRTVDLPGFCGERLAHFPCLSLEGDGALEAER